MTDISKCHGENCPVRDICYRFTAKADPHWQSYTEPDRNGHECKSFWSKEHGPAQPVRIAYKFPTAQPSPPPVFPNTSPKGTP